MPYLKQKNSVRYVRLVKFQTYCVLVLLLCSSPPLSKASTPDRAFLPIGVESLFLSDVFNLLEFVADHVHLEPWHSLHPTLSIGTPSKGRLLFGLPIQSAFGLHVLEPQDSYTTPEVMLTLYAINALVRRAYPGGADLMVLDIAQESGGRFNPHRSHQNGLDVDLRYYLKKVGPGDHEKRHVHASKIDLERMWTFLKLIKYYRLSTVIFIDHRLQKALYTYGEKTLGMSHKELAHYLSYPIKGRKRSALVQHITNHYHHLHVRFIGETSHEWRALDLKDADELHTAYLKNRTGFFEYIVQPGQNLGMIARFNQVRLRDLLKWNELTSSSIIRPGQVLRVWR